LHAAVAGGRGRFDTSDETIDWDELMGGLKKALQNRETIVKVSCFGFRATG
jgi:hypothetical protein